VKRLKVGGLNNAVAKAVAFGEAKAPFRESMPENPGRHYCLPGLPEIAQ
jgi:hypothetical protein